MIFCPVTLNADGFWQCPDCGWVYPLKSDKPPHRNCPTKKAPLTLEQKAEATKLIVGQQLNGPVLLDGPYPCDEAQQAEITAAGEQLKWKPEHVARWAAALARWIKAGRPLRTDEEVAEIVVVCKECDKYKADSGRCSLCGCKILTPGMAILSKAKLGTERCPRDKW